MSLFSKLGILRMTDHFIRTNLTKEEVARRQIDCAIQMYFENDDPIATHVIANAGWSIARDVCRDKNKPDAIQTLESVIRSDKRKEVRDKIREPYNFFKHADRDASDQLEHFDEVQTEWVLILAEWDYCTAFEQRTPFMLAYRSWAFARYPSVFLEGNEGGRIVSAKTFPDLPNMRPRQAKEVGRALIVDQTELEVSLAMGLKDLPTVRILFRDPRAITIYTGLEKRIQTKPGN